MGVVAAVIGAVVSVKGYSDAKEAAYDSRVAQEKQASESKAQNAAAAATERRKQVREERVRRARLIQSSENTGVSGSSGEFGALGGLATELSSNIGSNIGNIASANRSSEYAQQSATAQFDLQSANQMTNLGTSIFNMSGGFGKKA